MYFRQRNPLDAVYRMHKMYRLTKLSLGRSLLCHGIARSNTLRAFTTGENLPDFHGAKTF
jgi:hypothetical protein